MLSWDPDPVCDHPQSSGLYRLHQSLCKVEELTWKSLDQSELTHGAWVWLPSPVVNGQTERCIDLSTVKKGKQEDAE